MSNIVVTVRAIALHQGKLLMCRQHPQAHDFYNLPGGRLEAGETIETAMAREMLEETGVTAHVGRLLFINQFIKPPDHRVEFFFEIENAADYLDFDPAKASHHYEVANFVMADPTDPKFNLKPSFLTTALKHIGPDFVTQIVTTH